MKRDLRALKSTETVTSYENKLIEEFSKTDRSRDTTESWLRLKRALQSAKNTLPAVKRHNVRKHETSETTRQLVDKRTAEWENMTAEERKFLNVEIKRSARND